MNQMVGSVGRVSNDGKIIRSGSNDGVSFVLYFEENSFICS